MPALKNTRHELFAQGLVERKTASQAYIEAGYRENDGNATRLRQNDEIVARVAELQERALNRHDITVDTLTDELEEARLLAHQGGQAGAAVSAILGKAKLHGLGKETVQHVGNDLADVLKEIDGGTRGISTSEVIAPDNAGDLPTTDDGETIN